MTLLIASSAFLSLTFLNRKLLLIDRIALFLYAILFFWQIAVPKMMIPALGGGFACLLIAGALRRLRERHVATPWS